MRVVGTKTLSQCKRLYSTSKQTVGFIGLGNMGSGMANNLLTNKIPVMAFDVVPAAMQAITAKGAQGGQSVQNVASSCSNIVTMLPTDAHVEKVYTDLFQTSKAGTLLIDCSTVDPSLSKQLAQEAESKKVLFVDAPVSGGVNAAKSGTLTFMAGGTEDAVNKAKQVLLAMGKNVIHCGAAGCGSVAKICNNMQLAISMIGTCETMNLGQQLGLDPKILNGVLNLSSGKTWVSEVYSPVPGVMDNVPSSNDYNGGFATALMAKDLRLAQAAATRTMSPIPLGSLAQQFYNLLCTKGLGHKDFAIVYKFFMERSK